MIVGLPKGLYYYKHHKFLEEFLNHLHISYISSPDTNKNILNEGIATCVDEACLPIKVFHGHVSYLKDKCDLIITPRIVREVDGKYICPKFCGIPEMIQNSISDLPTITTLPIKLNNRKSIYNWCRKLGKLLGKNKRNIERAYTSSINYLFTQENGINDSEYPYKVALLGHPYSLYDKHVNMNVIKKLHDLETGVITENVIDIDHKNDIMKELVKRPFWSNMINAVGSGVYFMKNHLVDGIIYLSSFQCGIDSVAIELLEDILEDLPVLVLKLDEHSGQAGMDTRIEAFTDMLKRREYLDFDISTHG